MTSLTVVLPTYNEAENIRELIGELLKVNPEISVLVIDDNSPDATAELAGESAKENPRVKVIKNACRTGRGSSGVQGFEAGIKAGAELLLEMDADFSHPPEEIPKFLAAAPEADLVIGSRFCKGGGIEGRSVWRDLASNLARLYLQLLLGLKVKDPTSGFRLWKKEALEKIDYQSLKAADPFIITESLYRASKKGLKIKEVPITFKERRAGSSKLKLKTLLIYLLKAAKLRLSS